MISTLSSDVGGLAILSFPELLSGLGVPLLLLLLLLLLVLLTGLLLGGGVIAPMFSLTCGGLTLATLSESVIVIDT